MSRNPYRISIALMAVWGVLAGQPGIAMAAGSDDDRWVPSLALVFGFAAHQQDGDTVSRDLSGGEPPQPSFDGSRWHNTFEVGGSLELMTPQIPVPGMESGPRLFVSGEILHVSSQTRRLGQVGAPGELIEPETSPFEENAILGQGANNLADIDNIQYGATAGISFPVDIADYRINIKPSARYMYREIDYNGSVVRAFRPLGAIVTRSVELFGSDSQDLHAVGPALELELETTRIRSIGASFYVSGGAYKVVSDKRNSYSATRPDSLGVNTYTATWSTELSPWLYRANLGLRIKWMGFRSGWLGRGKR